MLIFDIGCNKGDFYEVALSKHRDCKVIAVDANPQFIYETHRENLKLVHAAVSNQKDVEIEFFIDDRQTGVSTASEKWMKESRFSKGNKYLRPNNSNWDKKIVAKTTTLDNLIEEYGKPDLIKIDVEGLEPQVIEGLSQKVGKICFEWTEEGVDDLERCVSDLYELGYRKFGLIGYFENVESENVTQSHLGDAHMIEPEKYLNYMKFVDTLSQVCDSERRINWGMAWAK